MAPLPVAFALSWSVWLLAAFVLATVGRALLSMTSFAWRAGQDIELSLTVAWVTLTLAGLGMSVWFFAHCRGICEGSGG